MIILFINEHVIRIKYTVHSSIHLYRPTLAYTNQYTRIQSNSSPTPPCLVSLPQLSSLPAEDKCPWGRANIPHSRAVGPSSLCRILTPFSRRRRITRTCEVTTAGRPVITPAHTTPACCQVHCSSVCLSVCMSLPSRFSSLT